jgi:hypothetical protein
MSSHPLNTYYCLLGGFNLFSLIYRDSENGIRKNRIRKNGIRKNGIRRNGIRPSRLGKRDSEWASKSFIFHLSHFFLSNLLCMHPTLLAFIVDSTSTFCALDFYVMPSSVFLQIFIIEFLNSIKDSTCFLNFIDCLLHERPSYVVSLHLLQLFVGFDFYFLFQESLSWWAFIKIPFHSSFAILVFQALFCALGVFFMNVWLTHGVHSTSGWCNFLFSF